MLAAGGLAATWVFKKARVLAIFDDLDTILLMIPLKILIVGWAWQLGIIVLVMAVLLWMAWAFLRRLRLPSTAGAMFLYGAVITTVSEIIYRASKLVNDTVPIHIEVLLPAFVLGCMLWKPKEHGDASHREHDNSETIATVASGVFLLLVGLSMPSLVSAYGPDSLNWPLLIGHTLVLTVLANLGKMFAVFCYRHEAHWRERLAVSIAMWPRGEVGAGVLILSLSYGISGPIVAAAVLSLALNLLCTGLFIVAVKKLTATIPVRTSVPAKTQPGSQIVSGSESLKHFAESRSAESVRLYEKWKRKETS
jgi:Kef-type K+ transport system membrane component KefB